MAYCDSSWVVKVFATGFLLLSFPCQLGWKRKFEILATLVSKGFIILLVFNISIHYFIVSAIERFDLILVIKTTKKLVAILAWYLSKGYI